jgi:putative copper export protein
VLPVHWDTIRLFLHVTAATIWVGGQLTLAGLAPGLRASSPDAPRAAARRFNLIAWPAYFVLVMTGIWNVFAIDDLDVTSAYGRTLMVKVVVAVLSGVAAFLHSISRSRTGLAVWGALSALSAVAALFLGVLLAQY